MAYKYFISLSILIATNVSMLRAEVPDPFESVNRTVFSFNDTVDIYALEPVARTYEQNVPDGIQRGVTNFFRNLRYPRYLVSDVMQLKIDQVVHHTGRFLINSTIGLLGLFDVAKCIGLEDHQEDIGIALGYWGIPTGPYIVIPFLGPSNLRDTIGTVADYALDPLFMLNFLADVREFDTTASASTTAVKVVDIRAGLLQAVEAAKESSIDYYGFTKSAYQQHRQGLIYDGEAPDDDE